MSQFLDIQIKAFIQTVTTNANNNSNDVNTGMEKLIMLLNGVPPSVKEGVWAWKEPRLRIEATIAARGRSYHGYPVSAGYFGSYCLDGLAMVLWSLRHSTSFVDCIVTVTNLLGDCDTTGAIAGQIAGAFYGYRSIFEEETVVPDDDGPLNNNTTTASRHSNSNNTSSSSCSSLATITTCTKEMGQVFLRNLRQWDPLYEIELRAIILYDDGCRAAATTPAFVAHAAPTPTTSKDNVDERWSTFPTTTITTNAHSCCIIV